MHSKEEYLDIVLPYRMKAIDVFRLAVKFALAWKEPKSMRMYFDDELRVTGLSTAWTNPVIESGIVHCRACLEFLGIRQNRNNHTKLSTRTKKRSDDLGIEDYGLPLLTVDDALNPYQGPKEEAESALAAVIHCANKGVAHTTKGQLVNDNDLHLYEIAARGVPTLLINHLYTPLNIPKPDYEIASTLNEESV